MQKYSEDLTLAHEYYREQDYKNCLKVYDILFHKGEQLSIGNLKEYAISLQKNMRYFESIEIARKILDKKRVDIDIFLALKSLRRQYTGFIHRDLTDLSFYISNNLNEIKKQKYEYISSILYKGE